MNADKLVSPRPVSIQRSLQLLQDIFHDEVEISFGPYHPN